jgi:hypothetical protein
VGKALTLAVTLGATLASFAVGPAASAETAVRTGGVGPHALNLSVSTDTMPGTSAARYRVPSAAPVTVRYSVYNSSEAEILNVRIADPQIPAARIACPGGTKLPALSTLQCTATVAAADGAHVRTVRATGTVYWLGTQVSATASTGYVGYNAGLSVRELVAGTGTGPATPAKPIVGSRVLLSYQITNTGDVALTGVTLHSTLSIATAGPEQNATSAQNGIAQGDCPGNASSLSLPPGGRLVCSALASADAGLHVDAAVASASPQLTVVRGNGALAAAAPVSASALGAYLGVAPPPSSSSSPDSLSHGSTSSSGTSSDHAPTPLTETGLTGSSNLLQGLQLGSGNGDLGLGLSGDGGAQANGQTSAGSAAGANGANGQSASGSQHRVILRSSLPVALHRPAGRELPVLLMIFIILLVPLIARRLRRHR